MAYRGGSLHPHGKFSLDDTALLRLDTRFRDDLAPARELGLEESSVLLGRVGVALVDALLQHSFLELRRVGDSCDVCVDSFDQIARRCGGQVESAPRRGIETGYPGFGDGRVFGRERRTLRARNRD